MSDRFCGLGMLGTSFRFSASALQQRPHGRFSLLLGEGGVSSCIVEVEVDEAGKILAIGCRDSEWTLDYEMPPLKIMQIRLAGLSRIDPAHGRRAALEIETGWRCWEFDEAGEPPALDFARLVKSAKTPT